MSEPKKVDRRKFIYAGLGAVALIAIGAAAYIAMNPPVVTVTKPTTATTTVPTTSVVTQTVTTSTTVPTTSVVTTTVPTSGETIVLTYSDAAYSAAIPDVLPQFTKETGINVVAQRFSASALIAKELTDFRARTGSHDVVFNHVSNAALLMGENMLEPLDDFIERDKDEIDFKDIPESSILFRWPWPKGKIYSLPFHAGSPPTLGVNKKHLEDAGLELKVPETYDEWYKYAAALTKKPERYGACPFAGAGGEHHTVMALYYQTLKGFGGDIVVPTGDGKWKVVVNSQEARDALKFNKEMGDKFGPEGWTGVTLSEQVLLYTQGKLSTLIDFSDYWVKACETPGLETLFGYVPAGKGGYKMVYMNWEIGIPSDSKHKEAAWKLIKFLMRKDIHYYLVQKGCGAVRLSEFNNPELLKSRPYYKVMGEALAKGYTFGLPMIVPWGEITTTVIGPILSGYYAGEFDVNEAITKMESMIKDILKKYNLLSE